MEIRSIIGGLFHHSGEEKAVVMEEARKAAEKMRQLVEEAQKPETTSERLKGLQQIKEVRVKESILGKPSLQLVADRPHFRGQIVVKDLLGDTFAFHLDPGKACSRRKEDPVHLLCSRARGSLARETEKFEQAVESAFSEKPPGPMSGFHVKPQIVYDDRWARQDHLKACAPFAIPLLVGLAAGAIPGLVALLPAYLLSRKISKAIICKKLEAMRKMLPKVQTDHEQDRAASIKLVMAASKEPASPASMSSTNSLRELMGDEVWTVI